MPATGPLPAPAAIETVAALDELLSRPTPALVDGIRRLSSPLLVLGAGGKMGPTLCVLARRAAEEAGHPLEIVAVSRFNDLRARDWLEARGVRTHIADLLNPASYAGLPDSANVAYLVGLKFGTAQNPSTTWAMNTLVPWHTCERFQRSRIVALSTGNVYPMSSVDGTGSVETDPLTPLGEYPNAAVARERLFEFESRHRGTPVALLRLFYAMELRYGVVHDLAQRIHLGQPIPLGNGAFTCIWQRDANEMALRSFDLAQSPPSVWNLCQPTVFSTRTVARRLGELLGREPHFEGSEAPTALTGDAAAICAALGNPGTSMEDILRWTAHWVKAGGTSFNKPTHFEVRDGRY